MFFLIDEMIGDIMDSVYKANVGIVSSEYWLFVASV